MEYFKNVTLKVPDLGEWLRQQKQQIDEFVQTHTLYEEQWVPKDPDTELLTSVAVQVPMDQLQHKIFNDEEAVETIGDYGILEWAKTGKKDGNELESYSCNLTENFICQLMEYLWKNNQAEIKAEAPECQDAEELNNYWFFSDYWDSLNDYITKSVRDYTVQDFLTALQMAI